MSYLPNEHTLFYPATTNFSAPAIAYSSIDRYDPGAKRDFSAVMVGEYLVRRMPLRSTPYILYQITREGEVLGQQISFPSEKDCTTHAYRAQTGKQATETRRRHAPSNGMHDINLSSRAITLLRAQEMDLQTLAVTMGADAHRLFTLLTDLVRKYKILRRGTPHRYLYRAT
ncbi:hypothetical protein [Herbaspirillum sp. NPDC101396]|uniref:hypothetical protein n=1 Tax=Herbaspirillum sp. NPDC101396 TaxID=3364005 RepID=UPI00383AF8FB